MDVINVLHMALQTLRGAVCSMLGWGTELADTGHK